MRNISPTALATLSQQTGVEPITLVQVDWNGQLITYGDRAFPELGIQGKILQVNGIDDAINIDNGSNSTAVTVTLDDSDGSLKSILNNVDIQKRRVFVLQWFVGIPISDAFVVFEGLINTPITWKEGDRSLTFEALSKLEDNEVGFSVDDGQFENVPAELVGKGWPLVFGTVVNVKALMIDRIPSGATAVAIGIPDGSLLDQSAYIDCQSGRNLAVANCLSFFGASLEFQGDLGGAGREVFDKGKQMQQRADDIRNQVSSGMQKDKARLQRIYKDQRVNWDLGVIPILNGYRFVQGIAVGVKIGDAHYYGVFHGDSFQVISRRRPDLVLDGVAVATAAQVDVANQQNDPISISIPQNDFIEEALFGDTIDDDFITPTAQDRKEDPCGPYNLFVVSTDPKCGKGASNVSGSSASSGSGGTTLANGTVIRRQKATEGQMWWAQAGTHVKPNENYPIRYVCNIIPGTQVLGVAAKARFGNTRIILGVPTSYYTVSEVVYGTIVATVVTMKQPLSSVQDGMEWEDTIYVTVQSPVGPNIANIIPYLVNTWSPGMSFDANDFAHVGAIMANYPANFVLYERKNIVELLREIAYQSRCNLWIADDEFHIRYLPEKVAPVTTFTEADVAKGSLEVSCTRTEDMITQLTAKWKGDESAAEPNTIVLQNNVGKYGLHRKAVDFFIYNSYFEVEKSALFWMIRGSNVFKTVKFKTFLTKLMVEGLDTVTLNFSNSYVSNGPVDGIVQKAVFDSADCTIDMEVWVPVRMGEMAEYPNAIPAQNEFAVFPLPVEEASAGSLAPGLGAKGDLKSFGPVWNITRTNNRKPLGRTNDLSPAPTTVTTTVTDWGPPGVGFSAGGDPAAVDASKAALAIGGAVTAPKYVYEYKEYKELPRPKLEFDGGAVPGKVGAKVGADQDDPDGIVYNVTIFPDGLTKDGVAVQATQLQQDSADTIPANSWVLVVRNVYITQKQGAENADVKVKYFMQAPVWM